MKANIEMVHSSIILRMYCVILLQRYQVFLVLTSWCIVAAMQCSPETRAFISVHCSIVIFLVTEDETVSL